MSSWVEPIALSSLIVSADPRSGGPAPLLSALERAVPGRTRQALAASRLPPLSSSRPGEAAAARAGEAGEQSPFPVSTSPDKEEGVAVFVTEVTFHKSKAQVGRRSRVVPSPVHVRLSHLESRVARVYTCPAPSVHLAVAVVSSHMIRSVLRLSGF